MKVAHVTLYPPRGKKHVSGSGVVSYSKNLVAHISAQQTVVCDIENNPERYDEDNVDVRRVFHRHVGFMWQVHKELRAVKADVVHIQQELALFGGVATAYLLQWLVFAWRRKVVITLHGVVDPNKIDAQFVHENNSHLPVWLVRLAFRIIYKPLMHWASQVIVHEQHFKDIVVNAYGVNPRKVKVVPHGVETVEKRERTVARRQLDLPEKADIALFMGYATGYKGLDLLIEGFSQYAQKNNSAYLVIGAGEHPKLHADPTYRAEYARLQQKAAMHIPADRYQWRGFIPEGEIASYYSASDVSLYPYTTAMASSGPMSFAIGAKAPFLVSTAFADIFGQFPYLIFDRTPDALAQKLDHFFTHQNDYLEVSGQLKQQRSWRAVGRETAKVYQEVTK
jgi:glycosyltransferase involved in cell wall biosynthesis